MPQIEKVIAVIQKIGEKHGASVAKIAIAWGIAKRTTPIIGVTKPQNVTDAAKVFQIRLTFNEVGALEKVASQTDVDTRGAWEPPKWSRSRAL